MENEIIAIIPKPPAIKLSLDNFKSICRSSKVRFIEDSDISNSWVVGAESGTQLYILGATLGAMLQVDISDMVKEAKDEIMNAIFPKQ